MMDPGSVIILTSVLLGLVLAIPSNTCIVIANLETIRRKGKLSPSNVIFMVKGIVNILLQSLVAVHGMLLVLSPEGFYIREVYSFMNVLNYFLLSFSFWLTAWLSAHYCTTITNLSYGFFIWVKRIISNFLSQILFLTALGIFPVSVLNFWAWNEESILQTSDNSTEAGNKSLYINLPCFVPVSFLGCILPFCLSLLCLLLTFSFLVRHVWRVKNNDSGSSRPNLQAHVTALRTIFFLLFMFTSFFVSQLILIIWNSTKTTGPVRVVSWVLLTIIPTVEAAVIFQASNKLRRNILRRFWI